MSPVAVWEPASGREANAYRLNRIRDHPNAYCRPGRSSTGKTRNQPPTRGSELLCRRRPLVPVGSYAEGRAKAYAKAEEILAKDFGIVPIFNYVNPRLVKPYVKGYSGKDPQDHIYLRNLYIIKH